MVQIQNNITQGEHPKKCNQNKDTPKKVAIVDNFSNKSIYVDFDFSPDVSHGEAIERFVKEGIPNAEIKRYDIKTDKGGAKYFEKINIQLEKLLTDINSGKNYDALNLSQSSDFIISSFKNVLGHDVTPENIFKYKSELREGLFTSKVENDEEGKTFIGLREAIKNLDKISDKGVKIYICAGNMGKECFNAFTLAKGASSVGANDEDDEKANFSADNSLVNKFEKGVFNVEKLEDKKGRTGFDYTNDGTIDIYSKNTTSFIKLSNPFDIKGTSFSTPKALARDLWKK